VLTLEEPAQDSVRTAEPEIPFRGRIEPAAGASLTIDGTRVPLDAEGRFQHVVRIEAGATRAIHVEGTAAGGARAAPIVRTIVRDPLPLPWKAPLAAALAAMAADDGDAAAARLREAEAAAAPPEAISGVARYVQDWERPATLEVRSPVDATSMTLPDGKDVEIPVEGEVLTGRRADHLFVNDQEVDLPANRALDRAAAFRHVLLARNPGPFAVVVSLRGPAGERARVVRTVTLARAPAPVPPGPKEEPAPPSRAPTTPAPFGLPKTRVGLTGDPDGPPPSAVTPAGVKEPDAEELAALAEVNRLRAAQNIAPIRFEARLFAAARAHSEEQLAGNYLGHGSTDPDRATLGQRMAQAGYVGRMYAEVVAKHFVDARSVVAAWMDSPRHREVLLDPELNEGAFSRVSDPKDPRNNRWTGDFGTRIAVTAVPSGNPTSSQPVPVPRTSIPPAPVPSPAPSK
jgi:uncharacterized protein YkwD